MINKDSFIRICASSWSTYIHIAIWCTAHTTSNCGSITGKASVLLYSANLPSCLCGQSQHPVLWALEPPSQTLRLSTSWNWPFSAQIAEFKNKWLRPPVPLYAFMACMGTALLSSFFFNLTYYIGLSSDCVLRQSYKIHRRCFVCTANFGTIIRGEGSGVEAN